MRLKDESNTEHTAPPPYHIQDLIPSVTTPRLSNWRNALLSDAKVRIQHIASKLPGLLHTPLHSYLDVVPYCVPS